jgi:hypothetical protein
MIVVIQCASRKHERAGFFTTQDGRRVLFVADPSTAPLSSGLVYARPDDPSDRGASWRELLSEYNRNPNGNQLKLYPAVQLYTPPIYGQLAQRFGVEKTYILSAGWGLIAATFLTPVYDITFSNSAEQYKRRARHMLFAGTCVCYRATLREEARTICLCFVNSRRMPRLQESSFTIQLDAQPRTAVH